MSSEDIVVVATVREEIRNQRALVDTAEMERRIQAAQVKVVAHVDDDDDDSESKAEHVTNTQANTISKVGGGASVTGGESATYPNTVFPGGQAGGTFSGWPWLAGAPRAGVPNPNVGATPPVTLTAQSTATPSVGLGGLGKKEKCSTPMGSASPSVVVDSTGGTRPAVPPYPHCQWPRVQTGGM